MPVNNAINKIITPTPTALAVPTWDSNINLSSNNIISGFATTARSNNAGYPLTVASPQAQRYTGSAFGDEVLLPFTNTLALNQSYTIINSSTSPLDIKDSTNTNIIYASLAVGFAVTLICILQSGATPASWSIDQPFRPVIEGTFTPTFTFLSPGNLSVSYTTQTGFFRQFPIPTGSLVWMYGVCAFTPTFTTSSGAARISLATPPSNISAPNALIHMPLAAGVTFGAGNTYVFLEGAASSAIFTIGGSGSGKVAGSAYNLTPSNFSTTTACDLRWEGWYRTL